MSSYCSYTPRGKRLHMLPANFQEVVILKEMKFDKEEKTLDIIRELLYLYSVIIFLT